MIAFISGHLDITDEEFVCNYKSQIDRALSMGHHFVVGDARGADSKAQSYLRNRTKNVCVYHMFENPRNNCGFITCGGFQTDAERDAQMTSDSTYDIAWVRPGRGKSGTQKNINRRLRQK